MASDQQEDPQDFKSLQDDIQKSLVAATRTVNRLAAEDLGFQRAVNPDIAKQLDDKTARLLKLSSRLMRSASRATSVKKAPRLDDAEDIDTQWRGIVDVVDSVLEKSDTALDEFQGVIKRKLEATTAPLSAQKPKGKDKVVRNANITKPQLKFKRMADNTTEGPWKPFLQSKPHAVTPLNKSLKIEKNDDGNSQYTHPYETEITRSEYPRRAYEIAEPIPYKPADKTEATWVDTWEGVLEMLEELKGSKEIAIDLEHHDMRSYAGIVCLMQISNRDQDWIVDTLQPWRHDLSILNEVFADPSIIKVFHGAAMDMKWLQRDLGLYVNGLFDTYFACRLLHYQKAGLAYLLSKFVGFEADKRYQMADWRVRPIPEEMLAYARSDTHYLLYIYDCVRNELVEKSDRANPEQDLIGQALEQSKTLSLTRHEDFQVDPESGRGQRGWLKYVMDHPSMRLDSEQFAIFKALWNWRDRKARLEDENPIWLLPPQKIQELSQVNPPDAKALHSLIPRTGALGRGAVDELWEEMKTARAKGGPSLLQFLSSLSPGTLEAHGNGRRPRAAVATAADTAPVAVARLSQSQLFGGMAISSKWEDQGGDVRQTDDYVPFPWQRFVQQAEGEEFTIDEGDAIVQEAPEPAAAGAAAKASEPDSEEEIVLKKGSKRKSDAMEQEEEDDDDTSSSGDSGASMDEGEKVAATGVIDINDDEPVRRLGKGKAKKRKKDHQAIEKEKEMREEAKKARRQRKLVKRAKTQKEAEEKKKFDAVPFDYSQAASVLHPKKEDTTGGAPAKGKKKKEAFDPYSKTGDDLLKGARKAPPIKGERSATFSN